MTVYRVEYEASGGHLHAWRSGTGRFTMRAPDDATDEDVQRTAEGLALERARRRLGHNAGLGTVTVAEAGDRPREFKVYRYWTVEYRSVSTVQARTVEEAIERGLADDDYSDAEALDGSDGPTEVGRVVEIVDGEEIECDVPGDDE